MVVKSDRPVFQTNRHGAIGDYAAFSVKPSTLDELVAAALSRDAKAINERSSTVVAKEGDFLLRRYVLGSDEISRDFQALDQRWFVAPERRHYSALFGVIGPDDRPQIVFDVIEEDGEGPKISFVFNAPERTVSNETVAIFLNHLDVPASWRGGADHEIAERFDAYWNKEMGGWEIREPQFLAKVSFARHCFHTRPTLSETVDVFVAPPECDIEDADTERAYQAKEFCRDAAWEEFQRFPQFGQVRPGFSSWMTQGDPQLVKVVSDGLDAEIDRLKAEMDGETFSGNDNPEFEGP